MIVVESKFWRKRYLQYHVFWLDISLVSVLILEEGLLRFLVLWEDRFQEHVDLHHGQDMFQGLVVIVMVYPISHYHYLDFPGVVYLISIPARSKHVRAMLNSLPSRT
jgi:hypothetical protein